MRIVTSQRVMWYNGLDKGREGSFSRRRVDEDDTCKYNRII